MMIARSVICFLFSIFLLSGCSSDEYSLDSGIPRLQSPVEEIDYIRTKWKNGKHVETVFFDSRNRALEIFSFGRYSTKRLNQYQGNLLTTSIYYEHSDSFEPGYVTIDTLHQEFDANKQLTMDAHFRGWQSKSAPPSSSGYIKRYLRYSATGDTIIEKKESSYDSDPYTPAADVSRWEYDHRKRLVHYYRLYVVSSGDTSDNFSQRYDYDTHGRLKMAWFDHMYLGMFYISRGPDTTWYRYNAQNRLVEEEHRYTTDMKNKSPYVYDKSSPFDKQSLDRYKKQFFEGTEYSPGNNRTDIIKYKYEKFNRAKLYVLEIPDPD